MASDSDIAEEFEEQLDYFNEHITPYINYYKLGEVKPENLVEIIKVLDNLLGIMGQDLKDGVQRYRELQIKIADYEAALEGRSSELDASEALVRSLRDELRQAKLDSKNAKENLDLLLKRISEKEGENATKSDTLREDYTSISLEHGKEIDKLVLVIDGLRKESITLKSEIDILKTQNAAIKVANDRLLMENNAYIADVERLTLFASELEKNVKTRDVLIGELKQKKEAIEKEHNEFIELYQHVMADLTKKTNELDACLDEKQGLQFLVQELETELIECKGNVEALSKTTPNEKPTKRKRVSNNAEDDDHQRARMRSKCKFKNGNQGVVANSGRCTSVNSIAALFRYRRNQLL